MDYSKFTVNQLKEKLQNASLPTNGKKKDLINRLEKNKNLVQTSEIPSQTVRITRSKFKSIQDFSNDNQNSSKMKDDSVASTSSVLTHPNRSQSKTKRDLVIVPSKRPQLPVETQNVKTNGQTGKSQDTSEIDVSNLKLCHVILEKIDVSKYRTTPVNVSVPHQSTVKKVQSRTQDEAKKDDSISSTKTKRDLEIFSPKRPRLSVKTQSLKANRQKRESRKLISSIISLKPALRAYELVWARIRGYANWPGVIEKETSNGKYLIHFFGDYTKSEVTKAKISHLMEGFQQFSKVKAPTALLQKSIRELSVFVRDQNQSSCPICNMLEKKNSI